MTLRTLRSAANTLKANRFTLFMANHFGSRVLEDGVLMANWRGKDYFLEEIY